MAQMLIDHGASIHALDMNNANILFFACAANRPEMVKFLLDKVRRVYFLTHRACAAGCCNVYAQACDRWRRGSRLCSRC